MLPLVLISCLSKLFIWTPYLIHSLSQFVADTLCPKGSTVLVESTGKMCLNITQGNSPTLAERHLYIYSIAPQKND